MKGFHGALLATITLSYPFAVYFGLLHFDPRWLALLLIPLIMARLLLGWKDKNNHLHWAMLLAVVLLVWTVFSGQIIGLKLYPVIISISMLSIFAWSLFHPPSIIERIARRMEPSFPDEAIAYTRKVTWVWCCFFACNGIIALITALWTNMEVWILYNGLISYLIMGGLFAGEWLVRQRIKRKQHA